MGLMLKCYVDERHPCYKKLPHSHTAKISLTLESTKQSSHESTITAEKENKNNNENPEIQAGMLRAYLTNPQNGLLIPRMLASIQEKMFARYSHHGSPM